MQEILPHSYSKYSAQIRPTETYYKPIYWKFYEDFAELFRFVIAASYEGDNPILPLPLFMRIPLSHGE